jgi:RNA recognition motif. (a.k.a. RRM, RBD, or RNP domain)
MFRIIIQDAKNVTITDENSKYRGSASKNIHFEELKYFEIRQPINNSMEILPQTRSFFKEANSLSKEKNNIKKYKKNNFSRPFPTKEKYKVSLDKELPFPRKRKNILTEKQQKIFDKLNEELDEINDYHEKQHKVFRDLDNKNSFLSDASERILQVENLPENIRIKEIYQLFKEYEDINFVCGTGTIYVKFKDSVAAKKALALNGCTYGGNLLKIQRFKSEKFFKLFPTNK